MILLWTAQTIIKYFRRSVHMFISDSAKYNSVPKAWGSKISHYRTQIPLKDHELITVKGFVCSSDPEGSITGSLVTGSVQRSQTNHQAAMTPKKDKINARIPNSV